MQCSEQKYKLQYKIYHHANDYKGVTIAGGQKINDGDYRNRTNAFFGCSSGW